MPRAGQSRIEAQEGFRLPLPDMVPVRPVSRRIPRRHYAALDLGTNNCRLLIAAPTFRGFRVVDAFSKIVRLGEGLSASGVLGPAAIERTMDALSLCRDKMERADVDSAWLVATEACRAAKNGAEFISRVGDELDLDFNILNRRMEASLAVMGCASLADPQAESVIVFDIGGGSTEIVWLEGPFSELDLDPRERIKAWDSLPLGVVTLAEKHGGVDVSAQLFETMVKEVEERIEPFSQKALAASSAERFHLLGTSGTVTTLGGIHLNLPRYDRRQVDGLWMRDQDIGDVMRRLVGTPFHERAAIPCIGEERADLVLAGCAILEAIRRAFPCTRLRIADRGLREGMLMHMMRKDGIWQDDSP